MSLDSTVGPHEQGVGKDAELLPERGAAVDARDHGVRGRRRGGRKAPAGPGHAVVAAFEDAVQRPDAVAESMDESARRFLEVPYLRERAREEQIGHVDGFPGVGLRRKPVVDGEARPAFRGEEGRVEAETGGENDAVVRYLLDHFVDPGEAHRGHIRAVGQLAQGQDPAVEERVLRCELVGVQEFVVHRPQMPQEVRPPRHAQRTGSGQMDDRRRLDQVVRRLEAPAGGPGLLISVTRVPYRTVSRWAAAKSARWPTMSSAAGKQRGVRSVNSGAPSSERGEERSRSCSGLDDEIDDEIAAAGAVKEISGLKSRGSRADYQVVKWATVGHALLPSPVSVAGVPGERLQRADTSR
ncbi:hypothetical protein AB0I84_43785 [Streptomyces spectabilis]|uniref:hypothetical protein n=1 Tax=Streptomyces spectabilis TaxID=68270 RepID=UPI0033F3B31E